MQKTPQHQQRLRRLEKSSRYFFHGSTRKLSYLEPRQQMNFDYKLGKLVADGKPAVCVTPYLNVAVFRALVRGGWTSFGSRNGKMIFGASREAIRRAKKEQGYVYVIPKKFFKKHSDYEYRALRKIRPVDVLRVTGQDLQLIKKTHTRRDYLKLIEQ